MLPSLAEAVVAAEAGLKELLCEDVRAGRVDLNRKIEIADDSGDVLAEVRAADIVKIEMAAQAKV